MVLFNLQDFLMNFGYFAVFALTILRSLGVTTILPIPQPLMFTVAISLGLNPFLVAVISGAGSTLGDVFAYFIGSKGRNFLFKWKKLKVPSKLNKILKKRGDWAVLAASITPLPLVFGFAVGSLHYDLKKFLIASVIGKLGASLLIVYAIVNGLAWIKGLD